MKGDGLNLGQWFTGSTIFSAISDSLKAIRSAVSTPEAFGDRAVDVTPDQSAGYFLSAGYIPVAYLLLPKPPRFASVPMPSVPLLLPPELPADLHLEQLTFAGELKYPEAR